MKNSLYILFFIPIILFSQNKAEINLTFGTYMDDHANREFSAQERIWKLKNGKLVYFIDAHDTRYSDTLNLSEAELAELSDFVLNNGLTSSYATEKKSEILEKYEYAGVVKGFITDGRKKAEFMLRAEDPFVLDNDRVYLSLRQLEQIFYRLIEDHRED